MVLAIARTHQGLAPAVYTEYNTQYANPPEPFMRQRPLSHRAPMTKHPMTAALAALALVALLGACSSGSSDDASDSSDQGYSAEIRRTEYGIPHIVASDHGGLGYGYGHAFAQDNLCVMADRVVTLRGERSRYFGPTADPNDPLADEEGATSNLASDIYYRGLRQAGVVRQLLARPAPLGATAELRQMVDGYVAGYNRYLRDTAVARPAQTTGCCSPTRTGHGPATPASLKCS
jgi:acyl-homoserine lactone acylase PvdQ